MTVQALGSPSSTCRPGLSSRLVGLAWHRLQTLTEGETKRERDRQIFHLLVQTHIPTKAGAEPSQSQKLGTLSGSPTWVAELEYLNSSPTASQAYRRKLDRKWRWDSIKPGHSHGMRTSHKCLPLSFLLNTV